MKNLTPTIAAGYLSMERDGVKLNIWDSSGSERFNRLLPMYVRGAAVIVLTYDLTHPHTLEKIVDYRMRFREELPDTQDATWIVVGNKADLTNENKKEHEGREFAEKRGMKYFSISAYTGQNIPELVNVIFDAANLAASRHDQNQDTDIVRLSTISPDANNGQSILTRWRNCCS